MKERRDAKYTPDKIDRWRSCFLSYLYNYKVQEVSKIGSRERVEQILKAHKIDIETTKNLRIYPPNDCDFDDLSKYHVVILDQYKERKASVESTPDAI